MIVPLAESSLNTKFGLFKEVLYYDGKQEAIALYFGSVEKQQNVLCRIHSTCIHGHYFNSVECDCQQELNISQQLISKAGKGIIILLEQEGKGNGHFALLKSIAFKRKGIAQGEAYETVGFEKEARNFSAAAKIIHHLNIASVTLLTNNQKKVETLTKYGVSVTGNKRISLT